MIALLLAGLAAVQPPARAEPMPNAYAVPAHCATSEVKVVDRYGRPVLRRLNTLPMGALQYAVDRRVNGCRVLTVVYGEALPDNPNPGPARGYLVTPSDGPARRR